MQTQTLTSEFSSAYVLFHPHTHLKILQILHPSYRHCAVLLENDTHFLLLDPLSQRLHIQLFVKDDTPDTLTQLAFRGFDIIKTNISFFEPRLSIELFSCVSFVKRTLGLYAPFILTPYQLYQYLIKKAGDCRLSLI